MKRVNVIFTDSAYEALAELAERRGTSMAVVLRDAISREKWLDEEVTRKRARLLLEDADGNLREIIFLR